MQSILATPADIYTNVLTNTIIQQSASTERITTVWKLSATLPTIFLF